MKMQKHLEKKNNKMSFPGLQCMCMQDYLSLYLLSFCPGEYTGSNPSLSKAVKQMKLI